MLPFDTFCHSHRHIFKNRLSESRCTSQNTRPYTILILAIYGFKVMIQWYAFQSKARKEQLLCEQLRIRQIETFFPRIFAWPARSGSVRVEPYFPGYVFGQVDLERVGKSILEWIPGAIGIVNFGGEPVSISDHLINALQQHLETAQVAASKTWEEFQVGDLITINGGPFAGYEGIFNARLPGRDRVEVFLRLIQDKQIRVELSIEQISLRKT